MSDSIDNVYKGEAVWKDQIRDEWRCRTNLMRTERGVYYCKLELRSEVNPEYISFVNVHLNRSETEIEKQIRYGAGQLADHQNKKYEDKHVFTEVENAAWESFRQMMLEIAEAGIQL